MCTIQDAASVWIFTRESGMVLVFDTCVLFRMLILHTARLQPMYCCFLLSDFNELVCATYVFSTVVFSVFYEVILVNFVRPILRSGLCMDFSKFFC